MALAAGAALGVALAAAGLLGDARGEGALPEGAVARVGDALIDRAELDRLVLGLEADTRSPATPEARRRVLDRLIDEELLVQRGLELGLAESEPRVRADLTAAVIRSVLVEAEDEAPDEAALRAFHTEQRDFFTQPGRLHVRQIFFRVPDLAGEAEARTRAERASARLGAGEPFEAVAERGDAPILELPDGPLPPAKLREYLGPTGLRAVSALAPGQVSGPVRSGVGYHLLLLVAREEPSAKPFEAAADEVAAEYRRRAGDRALRAYLDELRDRTHVRVSPELQ